MTSKHTPGPWVITRHPNLNVDVFAVGEVMDEAFQYVLSHTVCYQNAEANARLISAAPELLEALKGLLDDVQGLMSESQGVAGLHLNGDVADWASLDEGGRFERLSNMSAAVAAIAKATAP